jgi:DNA-binding FrmR family transcriptional regulator
MAAKDPRLLSRLSRIEGQVRGIARMIEEDRYCIDVLDQVQAIKAALKKVEDEILKAHAAHCVAGAINSGNKENAQAKFSELVDLFARYSR